MATSSSSSAARSPSTPSARLDKTKTKQKVVVLKLAPALLRGFDTAIKPEVPPSPESAPSPSPPAEEVPTVKVQEASDNTSESNSTPAGTPADPNSNDPLKKRKGPAPGFKRSLTQTEGTPKPRGKPGPKKKPRLEDGTIDHSGAKPAVGGLPGAPRLGPKANQGAINAGLRALDRSGKPCRKWIKKSFQLKSFTGVIWDLNSWKGNERLAIPNGEESSDAKEVSQQSSSDLKPNGSDVAVDIQMEDRPDQMAMSTPPASSPAPMSMQSPAIMAEG